MSTSIDVEWLISDRAAREYPWSTRQLARLARIGAISVRKLPGIRPAYRRDELERLLESAVRPRRETATAGRS